LRSTSARAAKEVRLVEHAGEEVALPESAAAIELTVKILGILAREMLHESADAVLHLVGDDPVEYPST